jgi:hypothetical protein
VSNNHNYLDELDNLLDTPPSHTHDGSRSRPTTASVSHPSVALSSVANNSDESLQAVTTWAQVIEQASNALQVATYTVQEAAQKNLDLAKSQQENSKELSDAASGWRHATRQAVQEVVATKKNIIMLTVLSGVIAVVGFSTTIGVMIQSRTGLAAMSNAVLENVDEHQTLVSKTMTLKMDELAATIERIEAILANNNPEQTADDEPKTLVLDIEQQALSNTDESDANPTPESNTATSAPQIKTPVLLANNTPSQASTKPTANVAPNLTSVTMAPAITTASNSINSEEINKLLQTNHQPLLQQITQLNQQLMVMDKLWQEQNAQLQKQLSLIPALVEEKVQAKLAKLPTASPQVATSQANTSTATVSVDNKAVLEQLNRLRQDLADIRQIQTQLRQQLSDMKATQAAQQPIYQYRNPDVERYPH